MSKIIDGVKVIAAGDLLDILLPNWLDNRGPESYKHESATISAWCFAQNAHYYARPRETFNEQHAVNEAIRGGHSTVVVEDLS